jgi:hypothetical protein
MNVTIVRAEQSNTSWKWMAVCDKHSNLITAKTKKELSTIKSEDFCSDCNQAGA